MPILQQRVCPCGGRCPGMGTVVWGTRAGMGDAAPFYPSLWLADLKAILTPGNTILPSDVQSVKDSAAASIRKAGGTEADVQAAMQQIDATIAGVPGALRQAGNPAAPFSFEDLWANFFGPGDPNSPTTGFFPMLAILGVGILALVVIRK